MTSRGLDRSITASAQPRYLHVLVHVLVLGRWPRASPRHQHLAVARGSTYSGPIMFILRFLVTAAALWLAVWLVPGITHTGTWLELLGVALVFGIVNALVRPFIKLLTCPLIILTLGLFLLVLNALMLWLTAALSGVLGLDFDVAGFWPAFWGALLISIVSAVLNLVLRDRQEEH